MESFSRRPLERAQIRHYNAEIVRLMSYYLNLAPGAIGADMIADISASCGVSHEYAFAEILAAVCNLDSGGRDRDFFRNYFLPMVHELDPAVFEADPYYRTVSVKTSRRENWEWKQLSLTAGTGFVCRDFLLTEDRRMIPQIGFFMRPFSYPAMLENGREWMTLLPNEITTSLPAVEAAHGKVLTYGLGLGYFAFRASEKPDVSSVTVVDCSADVIALFREEILPQFPHAEKIRLVCRDAFAYAEQEMPNEGYDMVFADIWHDVGDGRDLYLRMKPYEARCPGTKFVYWIEDSIKCYLDATLWP